MSARRRVGSALLFRSARPSRRPARRRGRHAGLIGLTGLTGLVVLLAVGASACRLDVAVDIDVQGDGTGTITVVATADAELIARAPGALEELRLDDVRAAGWAVDGPVAAADGGATLTLSKPFRTPEEATAILAELNGPSGPLHGLTVAQAREFARVTTTLTGTVRLDGGIAAFADQALIDLAGGPPFAVEAGADPGAALGVTIRLRAPGAVVESSGVAEGGRVTWQPSLAAGESAALSAVVEERDRTAERARSWQQFSRRAIWVWLAVVAALAVVVGALLTRGARRAGPPEGGPEP